LIIHGTDDKTVPIDATGRALARTLPDARLVEIEGGAHGIAASHKSEVNTALLSFLGAEASYVERVAQVRAGSERDRRFEGRGPGQKRFAHTSFGLVHLSTGLRAAAVSSRRFLGA